MVAFAHYPLLSHDVDRATNIARAETARRIRIGHFQSVDHDDVVQDLLFGVVSRWPRFDSTKAEAAAFFAVVIRSESVSLIRRRNAAKRGGGRLPVTFDDRIAANCLAGDDTERIDLRHDVRAVVDALPPDLQRFARAMKSMSPTAAARSLGLSRRVAKEQLNRIRAHFVGAGFDASAEASQQ